jgi:HAD superfamily hydrolase (TIGR01509 family)
MTQHGNAAEPPGRPVSAYDAVLFDFDGVLADSEPVHFACWAEIVRPFGFELTWEAFCNHCVGFMDREFLAWLARQTKPPVPVERLREQQPRKRQMFLERMLAEPPVDPAVIDLVNSLYSYKLAVVTSSNRREVEPMLERLGIRSCFGAVVCGGDVEHHKPAPDPYLRAAELLGATRPLVVEDSEAGVASGRAAGFDVLRVPSPALTARLVREALDGWSSQ